MRIMIVGALLIFTFAFGTQNADAQCCCMMNLSDDIRGSRYATAYEELKNSEAVFYGQVVEMRMIDKKPVRQGADNYEVEIKFKIEKAWRSDLDEYITITEYSNGCLIGFSIASRWLVYAYLDKDKNFRPGFALGRGSHIGMLRMILESLRRKAKSKRKLSKQRVISVSKINQRR